MDPIHDESWTEDPAYQDWLWDSTRLDTWDRVNNEQFSRRLHAAGVSSTTFEDQPPPYQLLHAPLPSQNVQHLRPVPPASHSEDWLDRQYIHYDESSYLDNIFSAHREYASPVVTDRQDTTLRSRLLTSVVCSSPPISSPINHSSPPLTITSSAAGGEYQEEEEAEEVAEVEDEDPGQFTEHSGVSMSNMPPSHTTSRRMSVVDLTRGSSSPEMMRAVPPPIRRRSDASQPEESRRKRRRLSHEVAVEDLIELDEAPSAEEELRQVEDTALLIQAQQAAVDDSAPKRIGKRQCIICMENITNATVTCCGHYFCHECLTQALLAGERNSERATGNCPICRKHLSRANKKKIDIIPISFMKQQTYRDQKRLRDLKANS